MLDQGQGLEGREIDVTRGPAFGIAIAVPWAVVIWLAAAVSLLV